MFPSSGLIYLYPEHPEHKKNVPLRPIVSCTESPMYELLCPPTRQQSTTSKTQRTSLISYITSVFMNQILWWVLMWPQFHQSSTGGHATVAFTVLWQSDHSLTHTGSYYIFSTVAPFVTKETMSLWDRPSLWLQPSSMWNPLSNRP